MSSRTKNRKSVGSNQFISTSKTQYIKKCPISRANIVHFDTLTLYQNVSYKMVGLAGLEPVRVSPLDPKSYVRPGTDCGFLEPRGIFADVWLFFLSVRLLLQEPLGTPTNGGCGRIADELRTTMNTYQILKVIAAGFKIRAL